MTPSFFTRYASDNLVLIQKEIESLNHQLSMSSILGATKEHIQKLQTKRRYYQLVLIQSRKDGVR